MPEEKKETPWTNNPSLIAPSDCPTEDTSITNKHPNSPRAAIWTKKQLLEAVKSLIIPFVRAADAAAPERASGRITDPSASHTALVEPLEPAALVERLRFSLPDGEGLGEGKNAPGRDRLLDLVRDVLRYSVNTWDQGFLDKLYSSTNPVRGPHLLFPFSFFFFFFCVEDSVSAFFLLGHEPRLLDSGARSNLHGLANP